MSLFATVALRGSSAVARRILQLEDKRDQQLKQLALAVDAVLQGPYNAALEDMELAARPGADAAGATRSLHRAEDRLGLAFGNMKGVNPLQAAWAAVYLALICASTGRTDDALYWSRRAHECATRAADLVAQQTQDSANGRVGRIRVASEDTETGVLVAGTAAVGVGAAAAGVTIASGGLALVAVAAGMGVAAAASKGISLYRRHHLKAGELRIRELSDFLQDISDLRRELGDRELPLPAT